jgi:hypothetical protein
MKPRTLFIAVAVLAVLSLVAFLAKRPAAAPSTDTRIGQPLVERSVVEKAAKIHLTDQGKNVTLARQADGAWLVSDFHDLPADFQKLSGLVESLTVAKLQRLVTSSPERIARLEFKDTKIELLDAADKVVWTVTLGKNADSGGRYVRFGDEPKAFLADLNAFLDAEPKNWANAELLNLKPEEIAKIEVPFADGGAVTLSRAKKDDPWTADKTPAGQQVNAGKVSSLLSSIGNVRFTETADPNDANAIAAKANARAFRLTKFDGKAITVSLGRKPEEKKIKPPAADASGKSGPAALGPMTDLLKDEKKSPADAAKSLAPEFETIPAGPVFAFVSSTDPAAPVNAWMQKRAFQISDFTFTSLPQKPEDLFEAAPAAVAAPAATESPKAGAEKADVKK